MNKTSDDIAQYALSLMDRAIRSGKTVHVAHDEALKAALIEHGATYMNIGGNRYVMGLDSHDNEWKIQFASDEVGPEVTIASAVQLAASRLTHDFTPSELDTLEAIIEAAARRVSAGKLDARAMEEAANAFSASGSIGAHLFAFVHALQSEMGL